MSCECVTIANVCIEVKTKPHMCSLNIVYLSIQWQDYSF